MMRPFLMVFCFFLLTTCRPDRRTEEGNQPSPAQDDISREAILSSTDTIPVVVLSGLFSWSPEKRTFEDCATKQVFWVNDPTGDMERTYKSQADWETGRTVYVELETRITATPDEGTGSHFESALQVRRLLKMEQGNCPD